MILRVGASPEEKRILLSAFQFGDELLNPLPHLIADIRTASRGWPWGSSRSQPPTRNLGARLATPHPIVITRSACCHISGVSCRGRSRLQINPYIPHCLDYRGIDACAGGFRAEAVISFPCASWLKNASAILLRPEL